MKNITEFSVFNLNRALTMKGDLTSQGKTPEEVQTGLGEAFKLEGEKLKYFVASLDLVQDKTEGLKRVLVVSFSEGEAVPQSVQKVEEQHYLLDYFQAPRPAVKPDEGGKGRGKGRGGRDRGPRRDAKGPKGPKSGDAKDAPKVETKSE